MSPSSGSTRVTPRRPKTEKLAAVRGGRGRWLRWIFFFAVCGAVLGAVSVLCLFLIYAADPDLPRIEAVSDYRPKVVTRVLAADGQVIGEIFEERRTVVPREKLPPVMVHAIVDAEDAEFYEHSGLSYWGMLRALVNDLKPGGHMQGASTLTQQLVRNLVLHDATRSGLAGVKRKVQEAILSKRIESRLSKDEILYLYLNQIEFPYQRFGIEEAARFYFGKSVSEVDAGEAALLASLPKGPSQMDPWKHGERAKDRQRYVLSQMVRYHHLTTKEAEKFAAAPIRLVRASSTAVGSAPEFVDEVRKVLVERFGAKKLPFLGLTVTTTCDPRVQKLAREAVEKGLVDLDARQGYRKPVAHLKGAQLTAHVKKLAHDLPNGPGLGKIVEGVVTRVVANTTNHTEDGAEVQLGVKSGWLPLPASVDRYNPKALAANQRLSPGDVIRVRPLELSKDKPPILGLELGPQAAAVVLDPNTRQVKALVGGYGYRPGAFNRAQPASQCLADKPVAGCRQPGSSFKPFVYAAAFATEKFTPATVLIDSPQVYVSPGLAPWKPQNAEKEEFLGPVRLRTALARSLNTVASQLVDTTRGGVDATQVVQLAHDAGIEAELSPNPSLALGTSAVSLLEMTNAYATFDAGGRRMPPQMILQIGGEVEPAATAQVAQAMKPELAYVMTSMMTTVIEEGTAASARGKLRRPAAGKTGTTNLERKRPDAWFIGYTPDLVAGVWVGFDDMHDLGHGEQGARAALPMWVEIMQGALKGVPPKPFPQPPGVVVQKIDPKTGLLAQPGAPALDEVFLEGTAPTETAPAAGEANPDTFITDQTQ